MNNILKIILFIWIFCGSKILSSPYTGWEIGKSSNFFYIEGRKVFDTNEKFNNFPSSLTEEQKLDLIFHLTDYYLLKGNKEGIANIIYLLRNEKGNFKFADYLISILWKIKKKDIIGAKKKFDEFETLTNNLYEKNLLKIIYESLTSGTVSFDSGDIMKNLSCIKNQNYYSLCRYLKLKNQIDHLNTVDQNFHKDYLNLDRVLAPFFEEPSLLHPHLLHLIVPDLAQKLAYLGFAEESVHFQKHIILKEQLVSELKSASFEKISFYQMLSGNLSAAEDSLRQSIKIGAVKTSEEKNQIYLKLGAISYLKKEYKQSLNYYLNLNFKKWNNSIYNPFRFEPISIDMAKDLVAVSIWKIKGPVKAVKTLKLIRKSNSKLSEEELLIRTRIAQIIFTDKPEVAEKIAEEVIYTAQSRGWKRAEYAGTLLQGYIHIVNANYRKAVIHFTKSYGILNDTDQELSSEWMRLNGIVSAHIASGETAPIEKSINVLSNYLRIKPEIDEFALVKNFMDIRFNSESLIKKSVNYLVETKQNLLLLKLLYSNSRAGYHELSINSKSILQIPFVHRRMKIFGSFRPKEDDQFYKSILSDIRKNENDFSQNNFDNFDEQFIETIQNPFLTGIAFQKEVYLFLFLPEKNSDNRWKMVKFSTSEYKSSNFHKTLIDFSELVPKNKVLQIYFNTIGIDIYQYLKNKKKSNISLFHNYSTNSIKKNGEALTPVAIFKNSQNFNFIKNYSAANFEGSKTFNEKKRLHIWNFHSLKKDNESVDSENYQWITPHDENITFKKLRRRIDTRMSPDALLFTSDVLKKSFWDSISSDFYPFCDFWIRKGTNSIYYIPSIDIEKVKSQDLIKSLVEPIYNSENLNRVIANIYKNSENTILIQSSIK